MRDQSLRLKQTVEKLRQALQELESALMESEEEDFSGETEDDSQDRKRSELLSIPEVCQELGMGKSWVYRRLKSGEIPSIKLGRNIKVRREDLEEFLESQRYHPPREEQSFG